MNYFDVLFAKKQSGGGGTPTLITKTITENGTYNASSDNADGYSQVTVNVPYMEKKSASGDIASFSDGAGYPFLKVKANINPVQDLHGYDYPWVGGAGKNKFPYFNSQTLNGVTLTIGDDGTITLNGTCTESQNFIINGTIEAGAYSLCDFAEGQWPSLGNRTQIYAENIIQLTTYNVDESRTVRSAISTADGSIQFRIRIQNGFTYNNNKLKPMLVKGTVSTMTYEPYSNICPISGFTGVNVAVTGVNIWDEEWELGGISITTGNNVSYDDRLRGKNYISVIPNTEYRFVQPTDNTGYWQYCWYDENKTFISGNSTRTIGVQTAPSNARYLRIGCPPSYGTTYNNDISINYPSTDTSYHAYNGHVYPILWLDEAGIVYGGYIDLVSGVLTVTKVGIAEYSGETLPSAWISDRDRYVAGNTPTIGAQVVYDLATPQTYNLTSQQINTLLGQNNAWNNTNGQTEVEYFIPIE